MKKLNKGNYEDINVPEWVSKALFTYENEYGDLWAVAPSGEGVIISNSSIDWVPIELTKGQILREIDYLTSRYSDLDIPSYLKGLFSGEEECKNVIFMLQRVAKEFNSEVY